MLEVCCIVSPENKEKVSDLLTGNNIIISEHAEISIVEAGLNCPNSGLVISFSPQRMDLLEKLLSSLYKSDSRDFLIGSRHHTQQIIQYTDILYFRAEGNYVYAVTSSAEYEVKYKLYELEKLFSNSSFIRTGKSNIVNIIKVEEIIPWFGSRLLLRIEGTAQRVEVSRNYLKQFKEYLEI